MNNSLRTEQWATWICLGAGGILCIGLLVEFALGLAPCPLCMMQRIWFALTGIVAWIGLYHNLEVGHLPVSQRAVRPGRRGVRHTATLVTKSAVRSSAKLRARFVLHD